jgi:type VI secretion system FHA domain protein
MSLTLEVAGPQARNLGAARRKVFNSAGGSIGRLADNDWVLPDQYVSGRHAVIHFSNGGYFLEDRSSNGVFINSPDARLPKNQPYALKDGDRFFIDAYEIRVTITADAPPMPALMPVPGRPVVQTPRLIPDEPFATDDPFAASDPFGVTSVTGRPVQTDSRSLIPSNADGYPQEETDPLALLGLGAARKNAPVPRAGDLERGSPLSDPYRAPTVIPLPPVVTKTPSYIPDEPLESQDVIPDDYDPLASDEPLRVAPAAPARPAAPPLPRSAAQMPQSAAPVPRPAGRSPPVQPAQSIQPVQPIPDHPAARPISPNGTVALGPRTASEFAPHTTQAPAPSPNIPSNPFAPSVPSGPAPRSPDQGAVVAPANLDFAALLTAAGLDGAAYTPELAATFGRILRVVVTGIMDLLRARERIKDEFRMHMTTFKAADNNPLKFSANVEDALHNLLVKRNSAYLPPVEAFEDAFQDARNHQMAMLAGLRVAFQSMLAEFDPEQLQEQFDRQVKKGSLLSGPARLKYWDLYRERYENAVRDADSAFRNLFGEAFAKAYEEQMQRLKAAGGTPGRN